MSSLRNTLTPFFKARDGAVAPILAFAAIPLLATVGAAVDYSRASNARATMQAALDASGLALAKQNVSADALAQAAQSYFNANFLVAGMSEVHVTASAGAISGGTSLTLSAAGSEPTTFMRMVGYSAFPISVTTKVIRIADGLGCVLALNPSASASITGQGSPSVSLTGCSLYDDSSSPTAVTVGGSAKISALSVGVVGGVSNANNGLITDQGIMTGMGPIADPYADVNYPSFSGCDQRNYKPKASTTISPGVYCGGISINAGVALTLNPGIYYMDGGDLTVNGGATLSGTGVTIVFTSKSNNNYATATINGNATVNLTPPIAGPTAGISMFGDRAMPRGTTIKLNGGSTKYIGGAIYFPTGNVQYAGGADTSTSCTQIIGDTVTFIGNSAVAVNCSSYKTRPFSALVVRLVQ